jgi:hypothetical protein
MPETACIRCTALLSLDRFREKPWLESPDGPVCVGCLIPAERAAAAARLQAEMESYVDDA